MWYTPNEAKYPTMTLLQYRLDHYGKYFDAKPAFKTHESEKKLREETVKRMHADYSSRVLHEQHAIPRININNAVGFVMKELDPGYDYWSPTPGPDGNFTPAQISDRMYRHGAPELQLYASHVRQKMLTEIWTFKTESDPDDIYFNNTTCGLPVGCYVNTFNGCTSEGFKTILMTELAKETITHPVIKSISRTILHVQGVNPYTPGQLKNFWVHEEWVTAVDAVRTKQDVYEILKAKWNKDKAS